MEFWQRDVEESIRQGDVKPFVEESVMQVSNWGFRLEELKMQKKHRGSGLLNWLKSKYSKEEEEMTGFIGPIHIWQVRTHHLSLHCFTVITTDVDLKKLETLIYCTAPVALVFLVLETSETCVFLLRDHTCLSFCGEKCKRKDLGLFSLKKKCMQT